MCFRSYFRFSWIVFLFLFFIREGRKLQYGIFCRNSLPLFSCYYLPLNWQALKMKKPWKVLAKIHAIVQVLLGG